MSEELKSALKKIRKECIRVTAVKPGFAVEMAEEIRFAGPAYAENGDKKMICPDCGNELSFVFQFRKSFDKNLKPQGPLYCVFYCFKCMPIGRPEEETGQWQIRVYQNPDPNNFLPGIGIDKTLKPCSTELARVFSLPDYETIESDFPEIAELCEDIDGEDPVGAFEEAGVEAGCEMEPFTSIGGYGKWIQGPAEQKCPKCGKTMELICQVDSESGADLMWGDAGCLYVFQCSQHQEEFGIEMQCF